MEEKKISNKLALVSGIINENPVFVSLLGMCSTLAVTTSVEGAIGMGILFTLVMMGSNILISLLRHIIPSSVKIPCYIVIIATFVTIIKMLCEAFIPALYASLGVFISLIVVNCIILGRAEAFASKNGPIASILDGIGTGIGYTIALIIVAALRELIGTGGFAFGIYFPLPKEIHIVLIPSSYTISLFTQPAGGFLTLALVLAVIAFYKAKKEEKQKKLELERINELKRKKAEELAKKKEEEVYEQLKLKVNLNENKEVVL